MLFGFDVYHCITSTYNHVVLCFDCDPLGTLVMKVGLQVTSGCTPLQRDTPRDVANGAVMLPIMPPNINAPFSYIVFCCFEFVFLTLDTRKPPVAQTWKPAGSSCLGLFVLEKKTYVYEKGARQCGGAEPSCMYKCGDRARRTPNLHPSAYTLLHVKLVISKPPVAQTWKPAGSM